VVRTCLLSQRERDGGLDLFNELITMISVFKKRHPSVANIFAAAKQNHKVLLIAIDYAKSTHKVLFINGIGEELRQPFDVHNNSEGLDYLTDSIKRSCKKHRIAHKNVILGGEGTPSFARNFILGLSDKGHLVLSIHAKEAKEMRQTEQASTDKLDLIGIAKSMLHGGGRPLGLYRFETQQHDRDDLSPTSKIPIAAKPYAELFGDQEALQILTRNRGRLVKERTACTNRVHTIIDQLFPGFLSRSCPVCPFTKASLQLMRMDGFCARHIARQKKSALAKKLKAWGTHQPEDSANQLIVMAKEALQSNPDLENCLQMTLKAHIANYEGLVAGIVAIEQALHQNLTTSPASLLLSIAGIGVVLAASIYAELGASLVLYSHKELCSYSGIVPRVKQSGGPDKPAKPGKVRKGCNRILKNYLVRAAAKMGECGPEDLKDLHERLSANGQHADFIIARRLLRTFKFMMIYQIIYLPPSLRRENWGEETGEAMASYLPELEEKIAVKWRLNAQASETMDPSQPLGMVWESLEAAIKNMNLCGNQMAAN
jgi:transposase